MTQGFNWMLLAGFVFCLACWLGNASENSSLHEELARKDEQLEKKEERISQMHTEHALAIQAASEALKLRKEISEHERQRMCEAERILGNNPEYCRQPVPDDVRLLWQSETDKAHASD